MPSIYYIETIAPAGESVVVKLDAVTDLIERFGGSATSEPVADKRTISDTYITKNPVFTIKGIVSAVIQPGQTEGKDITLFTKDLKDIIRNGTLINFISADEVYTYCVLEDVTLSKTAKEGKEGWAVDMQIKQINLTSALRITIDESPLDTDADKLAKKIKLNSNTTTQVNDINEFEGIQKATSGFVKAIFGGLSDDDGGG